MNLLRPTATELSSSMKLDTHKQDASFLSVRHGSIGPLRKGFEPSKKIKNKKNINENKNYFYSRLQAKISI